MQTSRIAASLLAGALLATPLVTLARSSDGLPPPPSTRGNTSASASSSSSSSSSRSMNTRQSSSAASVSTDDLQNIKDQIDMNQNQNGGAKDMSYGGGAGIYPMPGGGVSVDASITKTITPDFVAINAYCDTGPQTNRATVKQQMAKVYSDIKAAVGSNGKVRKSGSSTIAPYYDPSMGKQTNQFSGNVSIFIRITTMSASSMISDAVENAGCTTNWDVRLTDSNSYESGLLDDLVTRLNSRKAIFEKLLQRSLTTVVGASMSTYVDGYNSYDPDTNTADATTTLTVSYDSGSSSSK